LRRFDEFLDACEPFRGSSRLLDYGAGDGFFAERARRRGWHAMVTEMSAAKARTCEAKGLPVLPVGQVAGQAGSFDVVVAHEVIEHVSEPAMLLDDVAALLRAGGLLYVTTPNIDGWSRRRLGEDWRIIEYPEHLNYFSVRAIQRLFAGRPLSIRKVRTTGIDPEGLLKSRRGRVRPSRPGGGNEGELLRARWEQGARARLKGIVNAALSLLRMGDTIKVWAVRTPGSSASLGSRPARVERVP